MKTYSNTLFFAENSEKERIDHFDIRLVFHIKLSQQSRSSAHLELSFLGGLISVSGSANYLRDEKASLRQKKQQIVKNVPPIVYTKKQQQIVKNIPPADREDIEVQSWLQGNNKGRKPSLKHAKVKIQFKEQI